MKVNKKDNPNKTIERPLRKTIPERRRPNPDDPYEEKGMPNKEMPNTKNLHHEEFLNYFLI